MYIPVYTSETDEVVDYVVVYIYTFCLGSAVGKCHIESRWSWVKSHLRQLILFTCQLQPAADLQPRTDREVE